MAQRPKKNRPGRSLGLLALLVLLLTGSLVAGVQLTGDEEDGASFAPRLALDLEGGTQLILTPTTTDGSEVTEEDITQAIEIIRQRVDASGVTEAEITSQGGQNIVVALPGTPSQETLDLVRRSAQLRFRPVLTLAGPGTIDPVAFEESQQPAEEPTDAAAEQLTDGQTEAPADAAGEQPTDAATEQPTDAATEQPTDAATEEPTDAATEEPTAPPTQEEIEAAARAASDADGDGQLSADPATEPTSSSDLAWITEQVSYDFYTTDCTDPANLTGGVEDDPAAPLVACSDDGATKFILGPTALEGTNVDSATSGMGVNQQGVSTGQWVVSLEMDGEGADVFAEFSQRLLDLPEPQNQFGIVLDGLVISNAVMQNAIFDGRAQISGDFTRETAATLANQLNFGSLPLDFTVQSEDQISATLGSEQLQRGVLAGLIGAGLVILYMFWQYRGLGLVSVASLLIAALLTYLVITILSWTVGYRLSLPGVVGMIVAVGITADSFIVYFERIRDEVREGRLLVDAVEHGWARARRTILASDAVNFLAALVLYYLAVGGVRGFAFTLGLTTLIDLLVVMLFTHPLMRVLIRTQFFGQGHRLSGLDPVRLGASSVTYRGRGRFDRAARPATAARPAERTLVGAGVGAGSTGSAAGGEPRSAGTGSAGTTTPTASSGSAAGAGVVPPASATGATHDVDGAHDDELYAPDGRRLTIAERRAAARARAAAREGTGSEDTRPDTGVPPDAGPPTDLPGTGTDTRTTEGGER
ncbi:protein translocase subunit SecD [Georgenia muralis]